MHVHHQTAERNTRTIRTEAPPPMAHRYQPLRSSMLPCTKAQRQSTTTAHTTTADKWPGAAPFSASVDFVFSFANSSESDRAGSATALS